MKTRAKAKAKKPRTSVDWRQATLERMRILILEAAPKAIEERKWPKATNPAGVPVWSHDGILCTGETYKNAVKLTFAQGANLPDPAGLFNAGLDGNQRRAIDIREGEQVNAAAFRALVRAAVARNQAAKKTKAKAKKKTVVLLSGGNPQIAKADGDAPVQAYIRALSGWKRAAAKRLDALIEKAVPGVRKAVKWNSPLYGTDGKSFFLGVHVFEKYVKVAFFRGAALIPPLPVSSKDPNTRYVHLFEDGFDEKQLAAWLKQAAALPGWRPNARRGD